MATKNIVSLMIAAAGFGYAACGAGSAQAAESVDWLVQQMSISDGTQGPPVAPSTKASAAANKSKGSEDKAGKDGRDSAAKEKVSRAPAAVTTDPTSTP
jgi:hypothetical protein